MGSHNIAGHLRAIGRVCAAGVATFKGENGTPGRRCQVMLAIP